MEREVIHINISNFMAITEQVINPELRDRPLVVAREMASRSLVFDFSERAYREGIRKAMPLHEARKRCPDIIVMPPNPVLYEKASAAMYKVASRFSPIVEQAFHGHLFIDITGTRRLFGNPIDLAARIKREFQDQISMDPTTGLAASKLVSKVGTRLVKPNGFINVVPGNEASFLKPISVSLLPGVGEKILSRMEALGIDSMWQLASLSDEHIIAAFGKHGFKLREYARGIDNSPVLPAINSKPKIRADRMIVPDSNDIHEIRGNLLLASEEAGFTLRSQNLSAKQIKLEITYADGIIAARTSILKKPAAQDREIYQTASELLEKLLTRRIRLRRIMIILSKLGYEHNQLELFIPQCNEKESSLQQAIDRIKTRFGQNSIHQAVALTAN